MSDDLSTSSVFMDAALPAVLLDHAGRVCALNRAGRALFESSLDAWTDVFDPRDRDAVRDLVGAVLAGRERRASYDARLRTAGGQTIGARLWAAPVIDDSGRVSHVVGSVVDISDQIDALERLERTSAAHAQFASNVSHEIRTPLHAIMGLAELLAASSLGERDAKLAAAIVTEAAALKAVIDDTLDMSRIDAGTIEIHDDVFSPGECSAGAIRLLRPKALEKGLDLTVRVDPLVPPAVRGDEHRLRQILVNLLNNAVKFTTHGSVSLEVSVADHDRLQFVIVDTGPGIPERDQASVFDPFVRLHSDSAEGGAGLGLAISSRLIHALDGEIAMESTEGVGTTFTILVPLPASRSGDAARPARPGPGTAAGPAPMVLVVEDSEVNQLLITSQLDRLAYRCLIAGSAPEAFALIDEHGGDIDVILMDWHLPGMDGLDATRAIRARELANGQPRTPVVAVTARAMAGDRQLCLDAGMDDFLAKPVGLDRLRECLATWTMAADGGSSTVEREAGDQGGGIDRGVIGTLVDELGDATVVCMLIDTFLAELPGRVEAIVGQADPRRAAHTLKSTAAMLGAAALAERCHEIERGEGAPVGAARSAALAALADATAQELLSASAQIAQPQ